MTLSPVSSTWMPPGHVPSARWARTKPAISRDDVVEVAGLAAVGRGEGVAVHRVARPHHRMAGVGDRAQQRPQALLDLVGAHPADQRQPAGDARRVERARTARARSAAVAVGPILQPIGLPTPRRNSTWAPSSVAGALADPQHVRRAVVPAAGQRVLAGERLLVAEDAAPRGWCRRRPRAGSGWPRCRRRRRA